MLVLQEEDSHRGEWTSVLVLQNLIEENGLRFSFFGEKESHGDFETEQNRT